LTHVAQDSETSLEAIFKSKVRSAWNFTLQKGQYLCMEKPLQTKSSLSTKWEKEDRHVERESWIRWGTCLLNQLPMHH